MERIIKFFRKVFKKDHEYNAVYAESMKNMISCKPDKTDTIIAQSVEYIKGLETLNLIASKTRYKEIFEKVIEQTYIIHDMIINNDVLDIDRLETYHIYHTRPFIDTFTNGFKELQKKRVYHNNLVDDTIAEIPVEYDINRILSCVYDTTLNTNEVNSPISPSNNTTKGAHYAKFLKRTKNIEFDFVYLGTLMNDVNVNVIESDQKYYIVTVDGVEQLNGIPI